MTKRMRTGMILGATLVAAQLGFADNHKNATGMSRIEKEVRREIVTLPFYSLFDNFTFRVDGETVTLMGKVSRPTLKTDAENVVKKIEGVEKVNNQIEVLPLSPNDDRIRRATYIALARSPQLDRYFMQAVAPIRIIVKNGQVSLEGVVANQADKNIAGIQANGVSGVFKVNNNLVVEK